MARENAKRRLAEASEDHPHGIINVGIFGEGTDSPSLNAVAFLELRKSPIDVIQAVGRAMRTAPGKELGYIICPILIQPNADPERWLSTSGPDEGWQELGQILLALRAHDQRIEDELAELLHLYIPKPPEVQRTIVAIASGEEKRIQYRQHDGAPGEAQEAVERILDGKSTLAKEFDPITEIERDTPPANETAPIITQGAEPLQYAAHGGHHSTPVTAIGLIGETKPTEPQIPITDRTRLLSDSGPSYVSRAFRDYLGMVGIKHILATPFHPQTNGKLERYHQTLKRDVNQLPHEMPSDLEAAIVAFVSYYNYRRYHKALGNVTPSDVLKGRREEILRRRKEVQAQTIERRRQHNRAIRELTRPLSDP